MGRIVDLTLCLRRGMRGVDWEPARRLEEDGWNARTLHLYSHCGTHVDAPRHFDEKGAVLDELDLAACVGPARVIDLRPVEPGSDIRVEDLRPWADRIGEDSRLLLVTGWSDRRGRPEYRSMLPPVSQELARWLAQRRIALLGVEPLSVADVNDLDRLTAVHRTLLDAGILIVEGLANLAELRTEVVRLVVLPLSIAGADGAPARAIAIEE